jgi:imidazolonepropionase
METGPTSSADIIWYNARIATMETGDHPFGLIENGAVAISGGRISWVGASRDLPEDLFTSCSDKLDCDGRLITPGLVDCHTHLVYGGNRAREFEMRLNGASYEEIARAGGGIISTVSATRNASEDELFEQALPRVEGMLSEGVTTLEIKSGYGLNVEDELKMLRVARRLDKHVPANIVTSFLGAHALPPEYAGRSDDYIDLICEKALPAAVAEGLADAVDAFCEGIAFSPKQVEKVFDAARLHNLPVKLHAEQLSDLKGAVLAARHGGLSVDHLEYLHPDDVPVLAENGTVAVLLPGAFYCLRETKLPPINALRENHVPIALASDSNPGSSPVGSLLLMLNMACTFFRMTPEETLVGVTRNGAKALGIENKTGTLEKGKNADMVLWDVSDPAELSYRIGGNPCKRVMILGQVS